MSTYPLKPEDCTHKFWKVDSDSNKDGIVKETCQGCGKVRAKFGSIEKMYEHGYVPNTGMKPDGILKEAQVKEEKEEIVAKVKKKKPHDYWNKHKKAILASYAEIGEETQKKFEISDGTWGTLQRRWKFGKFTEKAGPTSTEQQLGLAEKHPSIKTTINKILPPNLGAEIDDSFEELYYLRGYKAATESFLAVMNIGTAVGVNDRKRKLEITG